MIGRKRLRNVAFVLLCSAGTGCAVQPKDAQGPAPQTPEAKAKVAAAIPADLAGAVRDAELWGKAIYERYVSTTPASETPAVQTALDTVRKSVNDDCTGTYRAIAVMPPGTPNDRIVVYYIGEIPKSQGLLLGRHYRVETQPNGKGIMLGEPSTAACVVLPPVAPSSTAPRLITHTLSSAPNEYHVFLSLLDGHALEIVTDSGHWLVDQGRISYLGQT
jgi:hypothetical protein